MAKKAFPLRIHEDILKSMQLWADDELRSVNAQIEYVLRDALRRAGRLRNEGDNRIEPSAHKGENA
jgi:hypothetical protein